MSSRYYNDEPVDFDFEADAAEDAAVRYPDYDNEIPDNHTKCQGPCGEVFHEDDTLEVAGLRMCPDCYRENPDVVASLYEDLKADMMADDY